VFNLFKIYKKVVLHWEMMLCSQKRACLMRVPKKFIYWKNLAQRESSSNLKQLTDSIEYLKKNVLISNWPRVKSLRMLFAVKLTVLSEQCRSLKFFCKDRTFKLISTLLSDLSETLWLFFFRPVRRQLDRYSLLFWNCCPSRSSYLDATNSRKKKRYLNTFCFVSAGL